VDLSASERLILIGLLPSEGDIDTIRIVADLRKALSFTEEEHAELGMRRDGERIVWDAEADRPRPVTIGGKAFALLVEALQNLSKTKKLTEQHLPVYERFVEAENVGGAEADQTAERR